MHFSTAIAGSLLLAGQAVSLSPMKAAHNLAESLHQRSFDIEAQLSDDAYDFLLNNLEKRQGTTSPSSASSSTSTAPTVSTTPVAGSPANVADFNITQWNAMTAQACSDAISALNGNAGNPSGMAVCYNVPFLDNSTGVFESEVRLYNLSAPVNDWTGVQASGINVTMSYLGASVTPAMGPMIAKRGVEGISNELASPIEKRQSATLTPVITQLYIGEIHSSILVNGITV